MELIWYGLSCFRLKERGFQTVVTDPYHHKVGLPALDKLKADIVTVSHPARGHNYVQAVPKRQMVLSGPGEYEIGGLFITGIATWPSKEAEHPNVLYLFNYGNITVAHLGDVSDIPKQSQIEALEQVNVLLIPVGHGSSLNAAQAAEFISMLEPNIVVPMHYHTPGLKLELDSVDRFLKEMGINEYTAESSLKVSASNLPEETETVILTPQTS
ncbi:MAG TPA: MBL fold metallo-hydrolase [Anaerolineae bacterium]|nr:MBL fold metallo-hydrolase [Anaerolineae bacterium]